MADTTRIAPPSAGEADIPALLPEDPSASYKPTKSMKLPSTSPGMADTLPMGPVSACPSFDIGSQHCMEGGDSSLDGSGRPAFEIHRVIGRGGFGEVWEAHQKSLDRTIALKRLREDLFRESQEKLDSARQLNVTFRQEALTTARLEHPNIVPIYDLGTDGQGRPVLAMKLVRGRPWNEIIHGDSDKPVADFLAKHLPILIDVSQAVAFAHSKGIVHRDLKPSQVMVGEFGEVILMDWGLAAIFDAKLSGAGEESPRALRFAPLTSEASNPSGTAAFMAPEQTRKSARGIGPWTDVYLLGGTLYYLLTLSPPHRAATAREAFLQAMLGDVEPAEKRAVMRDVPHELSALCADALAPGTESRIAHVEDFIARLRDYLSGSTRRRESLAITSEVTARLAANPNSYRELAECENLVVKALSLWEENHDAARLRGLVLADHARLALANGDLVLARVQAERLNAGDSSEVLLREISAAEEHARRQRAQRRLLLRAAALMALAIGALGLLAHWRSLEAERAQLRAEQSALQATNALRSAEEQRAIAEARGIEAMQSRDRERVARTQAEGLLDYMLTDLPAQLEPLNRLDMLDSLARRSLDYFIGFGSLELDSRSEVLHSTTLRKIAVILDDQGRTTEADGALATAQSIIEKQLASDPECETCRLEIAQIEYRRAALFSKRGDVQRAATSIAATLAILRDPPPSANDTWNELLAGALQVHARIEERLGSLARAEASLTEATSITKDLLERQPGNLLHLLAMVRQLTQMAEVIGAQGRTEEALAATQRAAAISAELAGHKDATPQTISLHAHTLSTQAIYKAFLGDLADATALAAAARDLMRPIAAADTANYAWQDQIGQLTLAVGSYQARAFDLRGSQASLAEAIEIFTRLAEGSSGTGESMLSLARALDLMSEVHARIEGAAAALPFAQRSLGTRRAISGMFPENTEYKRHLAAGLGAVAQLLCDNREYDPSLELYAEALAVRRELLELDPSNTAWQRDVAVTLTNTAVVYREMDRREEAEEAYLDALTYVEPLLEADPANVTYLSDIAMIRNNIGSVRLDAGDAEQALAMFEDALKTSRELEQRDPANKTWAYLTTRLNLNISDTAIAAKDYKRAVAPSRAAIEWIDAQLATAGESIELLAYRVEALDNIARAHWYLEERQEAVAARTAARDSALQVLAIAPDAPRPNFTALEQMLTLARYQLPRGEEYYDEARAALDECLALAVPLTKKEGPLREIGRYYTSRAAWQYCRVHAEADSIDEAFASLEIAVENGLPASVFKNDEAFNILRAANPGRAEAAVNSAAASDEE